ncbi:MAG TPA: N-acetyltransferase [Roseiarcus sp.]|nr:N-acetyltransferase [Roseiarcus sp.]
MSLLFDPARLPIAAALPLGGAFDIRALRVEEERSCDLPAREALLDEAFGPARLAKTSQRLRDGRIPAEGLALVARDEDELVATLRCWSVKAGDRPALLLGPLAVAKAHRSLGIGATMMREALWRAAACGHQAVILVGDAPYYARFGFEASLTRELELPGPVDPARFLGFEIAPGALAGAKGMVRATGRAIPTRGRAKAAAWRRAGRRSNEAAATADIGASL